MPDTYILNQRPMGNGPAMSNVVEMLVGAGWTYQSSGTGTTGIFSPAPATVTISNASPGIVSWTTHGILPNVPVVFTTSGSLPAEIVSGQTYYVTAANFTANSFSVSSTLGGAPINTSSASTATTTATVKKVFTQAVAPTVVQISNGAPASFYWPAHGLRAGDSLRLTNSGGGLPTGLALVTTYFVLSAGLTSDNFRVSLTAEGAAINTTTAGSGIHTATILTSWGNANAWARIQDPAGLREFMFQHDNSASGAGGKIKYSASTKFTGISNGAISATVPPTAVDERYLRGAAASFGAVFFAPSVVNRAAIMQGAAMSTAPYGWWFAIQNRGGGNRTCGMLFDPVISVTEDPDPCVIHIGAGTQEAFSVHSIAMGRDGGSSSTWTTACGGTVTGSFAYMDIGKTAFVYVQPMGYACTAGNSGTLGVINGINGTQAPTASNVVGASPAGANNAYIGPNQFSGLPEALPIPWVRVGTTASSASYQTQTNATGVKGWSTMCRWTSTNRISFADTLDNKAWICVGAFWLRWDGVTTPVNY